MKKTIPEQRPLDNIHVYLEISRRFIFGAKVMPGYEDYQITAKQAIEQAIKILTPLKIEKTAYKISLLGCPYQTRTIIAMPPLRPIAQKAKIKK